MEPETNKQSKENNCHSILRNGTEVNKSNINDIVNQIIEKKLNFDQTCANPYGYRHFACFFRKQSNWWEICGYGRELYA